MSNNFQQTVDLKEQMERRKKQARQRKAKQFASPVSSSALSADSGLEQVYNDGEKDKIRKELQKISQPRANRVNEILLKRLVILLAIILVAATVYLLFFKAEGGEVGRKSSSQKWYTVKLVNGEIYYGQISDLSADPVVISNVYYNYDQLRDGKKEVDETSNIRLVKRGKETHGPDGTMNIVRSQILFMEPLKEESKVLQAILEYEK